MLKKSNDEAIQVAVGLRLGVGLCDRYTGICGARVDERDSHGPTCRRSTCRIAHRDAINDNICGTLSSAKIPCRKKPPGLLNDDNKRDYLYPMGERQVHGMECDDFTPVGELPSDKNIIGGRCSCGSSCVTEDQEIWWSSSLSWLLPSRHWNPGAHQWGETAISLVTGKENLPYIRWPSLKQCFYSRVSQLLNNAGMPLLSMVPFEKWRCHGTIGMYTFLPDSGYWISNSTGYRIPDNTR